MKKSSTIILLVAGITIILGIFLVVMSVFLLRGNYGTIDSPGSYEEKNAEFEADGIKAITVDTSNRRIEVVESTDDLIHITYYENEYETFNIENSQSGTLTIIMKVTRDWFAWYDFSFDFTDTATTIAIPASFTGEINLETSNGSISVSKMNLMDKLQVDTSNGAVEMDEVSALEVDVTSSNGSITLSEVVTEELTVKTSNGRITVTDTTIDGETYLKTSNASIEVDEIVLNGDSEFDSSNGRISGTIIGDDDDFNIDSHTSNGDNSLPSDTSGANKDLKVTTSNSDIDIEFVS